MIFRPIIQGALRGRETKFLYFLSFITIKIYFEQGAKKSQQSGAYTTAPRPMHLRVKADKYFTPNGKKAVRQVVSCQLEAMLTGTNVQRSEPIDE